MTRPYNHVENLKKTWFLTEKSVWPKKVFTQKKSEKKHDFPKNLRTPVGARWFFPQKHEFSSKKWLDLITVKKQGGISAHLSELADFFFKKTWFYRKKCKKTWFYSKKMCEQKKSSSPKKSSKRHYFSWKKDY